MSTADDISNLAFREPGQIVKMNVSEGQSVKKGTVIAEINPREYMLQMEADKATYLTAQSQLERNKRLIERQAISRQDYETAEAAYVRARTAYDNSKSILADTKLVAPFSGAVEKVYADNYQRVQAGEPVVRLVNPQTRSVKFTMPESGLQTLKLSGLAFTVRFDNYPNVVFDALLKEYVQSSTQAAGITVALTLDGQNVGKYDIAPGMACTVNLRVDIPDRRDMTGVPLTAV
ncbi:MAG: efflux RND transporter periplasmic adaptor subunit, partial [Alistipes indistinctus]|nr:efflux RND transporter periplasmic adaptor subunit [Alistipes indistinctus]